MIIVTTVYFVRKRKQTKFNTSNDPDAETNTSKEPNTQLKGPLIYHLYDSFRKGEVTRKDFQENFDEIDDLPDSTLPIQKNTHSHICECEQCGKKIE